MDELNKINLALFDAKPYDREYFNKVNEDYHINIKYFKSHLNTETVSLTKGFQGICVFVNDQIQADVAQALYDNGVKLIALRSAGYNNVDLHAVYGKIHVVHVPAYSPHAVAEHAAALILTLNRKTHKAYYRIRDNNFAISGLMGFDMYGKSAGIIGVGRIGQVLIKILNGFGMKVLAYDRNPNLELAKLLNFTYMDLDELYRESDIISLHCPLTRETYHLINDRSIAQMKDEVMIINTGRGQLIDTKALIGGLKSGKIGSAGLDVYEEESDYFFEDLSHTYIADDVLARLLTFNNVLVTSHQGFFTKEALLNIAKTTLENIRLFFTEGELPHEICYHCVESQRGVERECRRVKDGRCF
jgi:D-lactate dehydrogenase